MAFLALSLALSLSPRSNVVDDEEEMLYGDSNADATPSKDDSGRSFGQPTSSDGSSGKSEPSHWCMIIRENGVMEVRASKREASTIIQLHLAALPVFLFLPPTSPSSLRSRSTSCPSGAWCSW